MIYDMVICLFLEKDSETLSRVGQKQPHIDQGIPPPSIGPLTSGRLVMMENPWRTGDPPTDSGNLHVELRDITM